jgi:hypothetical protein
MEFGRLTKRETGLLGFHFLLFFIIPYLPRSILILTDMFLIRLALLAVLISSAYISPVNAIATFVLIALLFIERNRVKMNHMEKLMSQSYPDSEAMASIQTPPTAPAQPAFETPEVDSHPFMPQEDSGDNSFEPVSESINGKEPLPTEGSQDGVQVAIDQLFKWVNPDAVQAPL